MGTAPNGPAAHLSHGPCNAQDCFQSNLPIAQEFCDIPQYCSYYEHFAHCISENGCNTYKLDVYLQIGDYTRFILIFFYNKVDLSVVILVVEYSVLYQVYFDFLLQPIGCVTKWIS